MTSTLLLNPGTWDLILDSNRNIAHAERPYQIAQDVASTGRLFLGELWYDTAKGLPYFEQVLGHYPPVALMQQALETAAMKVPGVLAANATIDGFVDRHMTGQIRVTDDLGAVQNVRL